VHLPSDVMKQAAEAHHPCCSWLSHDVCPSPCNLGHLTMCCVRMPCCDCWCFQLVPLEASKLKGLVNTRVGVMQEIGWNPEWEVNPRSSNWWNALVGGGGRVPQPLCRHRQHLIVV